MASERVLRYTLGKVCQELRNCEIDDQGVGNTALGSEASRLTIGREARSIDERHACSSELIVKKMSRSSCLHFPS